MLKAALIYLLVLMAMSVSAWGQYTTNVYAYNDRAGDSYAIYLESLPDTFSIDIYMKNDYGVINGFSMPFYFSIPVGSIDIDHFDIDGFSVMGLDDQSIGLYNGFESDWTLFNTFTGFSWDGTLPDTVNYTTASAFYPWQLTGEQYYRYIQFAFQINDVGIPQGTLCIDSCSIPNTSPPEIYDWLFDDPTFDFGGPYCWDIFYGHWPSDDPYDIFIKGADTLYEAGTYYYACSTYNIDGELLDIDSCEFTWVTDCPGGTISDCGVLTTTSIESGTEFKIITSIKKYWDTRYDTLTVTYIDSNQTDIISSISEVLPTKFELSQNYPNPFNSMTSICFSLPNRSDITLTIYDITGRRVAEITEESLPAGEHRINYDFNELSSGVYFYQLEAGAFTDTKKMVLLK